MAFQQTSLWCGDATHKPRIRTNTLQNKARVRSIKKMKNISAASRPKGGFSASGDTARAPPASSRRASHDVIPGSGCECAPTPPTLQHQHRARKVSNSCSMSVKRSYNNNNNNKNFFQKFSAVSPDVSHTVPQTAAAPRSGPTKLLQQPLLIGPRGSDVTAAQWCKSCEESSESLSRAELEENLVSSLHIWL